jgi:hypothetical protein
VKKGLYIKRNKKIIVRWDNLFGYNTNERGWKQPRSFVYFYVIIWLIQ